MKQCTDSYIDPLTLLVNQSIQQGVFPAKLKIARVIPLYKGDHNQIIHNYRPIFVLSLFPIIFEEKKYLNMSYVFLMTIIFCMNIILVLKNTTLQAMP